MDFSSFLGEKRWEILETVARTPSSPIEIAGRLSATVSYISQQLKLLEVAGLVYKTKTGAAEKGKPRNVYSISNEFVHLSSLTNEFSSKKMLYLNEYHKAVIAIWNLVDSSIHEDLNKVYFKLKDYLSEISIVYLDKVTGDLLIASSSKDLKTKMDNFIKKLERNIHFEIVSSEKIDSKIRENHIVILNGERIDKGGKDE